MSSEGLPYKLIADKSKNVLRKTVSHDYTGHNLVFVVGCGRSGTTWLQRLLACHRRIRTGQESHIFTHFIGPMRRQWNRSLDPARTRRTGLPCYLTEDEFLRILKTFLMTLLHPVIAPLTPGELFLEKSPPHGRFIPEIVELLPRARFIHILRDPRDVVASLLAARDSWGSSFAPKTAAGAAGRWVEDVTAIRQAARGLPPWQFLEIRYEDLHKCPQGVLKKCTNFLQLEWGEEEILEAIELNKPTAMVATGGTPIPLWGEAARRFGPVEHEPPGFIRKAQVGSWKSDLSFLEKFFTWKVAGKLMLERGYVWPSPDVLSFKTFLMLTAVPRAVLRSIFSRWHP